MRRATFARDDSAAKRIKGRKNQKKEAFSTAFAACRR